MLWTLVYVVLGFGLVLFVFGNIMERVRGVRFRPGWTCGVVGLKGGGKSLFVARLVARRLDKGVNIVSNMAFEGCERMRSWEDLILAPEDTMVVLDEAHQWAKSQAGKTPDPMADWYISHARKLRHEVWWIAQHETQVAGFVKNQTNEMVSVEEWIGGVHRAKSFAPHEFRKAKAKALWSWWYSPRGAAIRVYDTLELVRPVISDRDSENVRQQKQRLGDLIDTVNIRRAGSASGDPEPATTQEPQVPNFDVQDLRLSDCYADGITSLRP